MGLDLRLDSWLSWQINDAIYAWGSFIDHLIHENTLRDKKNRRMYYHDIEAVLGIKGREEGWDLPDNIVDLEEGDGPEEAATVDDYFTEDGVARIDVKFDGKPTRQYMDPRALLNIKQGEREDTGQIKYEKVRYETSQQDEPLVTPKTVSNPAAGNIHKPGKRTMRNDMFNDTENRPRKSPADWDFDTAEKPEIPEDWTDKTKAVGADPRGRKGKHRYKRGGNFVVTEDGEVIWTE